MTRFARGSGSKASNEKTPLQATSWSEMKQQMLDSQQNTSKSTEEKQTRQINNENSEDRSVKKPHWEDFPCMNETASSSKISKKNKKLNASEKDQNETADISSVNDDGEGKKPKKKNKHKRSNDAVESNTSEKSGKKKTVKHNIMVLETQGIVVDSSINDEICKKKKKAKHANVETIDNKPSKKGKKRKLDDEDVSNLTIEDETAHKHNSESDIQEKNKFKNNKKFNQQANNFNKQTNKFNNNFSNDKFNKNKFNNENFKRRKPFNEEKLYVNGQEIEISQFQGFPVKKIDADRLIQLKKNMASKGIPRSEIEKALKLERRRAEKSLAREKKKVCFNCRQGGHTLEECPTLKDGPSGDGGLIGVCFKCGSTQHTYFQCKVTQGDNFKFAQCFICKERGHISRQCPDNSRGVYPRGGSCKLCGDVTHLIKDCPKHLVEKDSKKIVAYKRDDDIETLEPVDKEIKSQEVAKPKIIKF